MGTEREFKYLIDAVGHGLLRSGIDWEKAVFQESIFFDTEDMLLLDSKWALRLRFEKDLPPDVSIRPDEFEPNPGWDRASVTLKGSPRRDGALVVRAEYEMPVPVGGALRLKQAGWTVHDLRQHPLTDTLLGLGVTSDPFSAIGSFRNLRLLANVDEAEVALDFSVTPDGRERRELEVETDAGVPPVVIAVLDKCDHRPADKDKFVWLLGHGS